MIIIDYLARSLGKLNTRINVPFVKHVMMNLIYVHVEQEGIDNEKILKQSRPDSQRNQ